MSFKIHGIINFQDDLIQYGNKIEFMHLYLVLTKKIVKSGNRIVRYIIHFKVSNFSYFCIVYLYFSFNISD